MLKVWLDDERKLPSGYDIQVRTAQEAINLLAGGSVALISLDHDLGYGNGSGSDVAKYIEEFAWRGTLNRLDWAIHTANPVGRLYMLSCLQNANKYWDANQFKPS